MRVFYVYLVAYVLSDYRGRTQIQAGSATVLGIGPGESSVLVVCVC